MVSTDSCLLHRYVAISLRDVSNPIKCSISMVYAMRIYLQQWDSNISRLPITTNCLHTLKDQQHSVPYYGHTSSPVLTIEQSTSCYSNCVLQKQLMQIELKFIK